ncbi:MAG: sigma-70 family RNA polymerase sigma factor [Clostridia bacterium]|nr:sigma-70 family RNA polymerase sigma factor [Clostridia bacterium]
MNIRTRIGEMLQRLRRALAGRRNRLYYINGQTALPPPLTPPEEAEAIAALAGDGGTAACAAACAAARATLIEHNLRLVVYIAKKFENTGAGIEDLISIGTIGLIKAVSTFRAERNIKLATYASRCIENEILMYIRKYSGRHDVSIDEPLSVDWDGNELLLSDVLGGDEDEVSRGLEVSEEKRTIRAALSELDEREQVIITMRYGLDGGRELTQKEVADRMGISQSYISRLEKKILARLGETLRSRL